MVTGRVRGPTGIAVVLVVLLTLGAAGWLAFGGPEVGRRTPSPSGPGDAATAEGDAPPGEQSAQPRLPGNRVEVFGGDRFLVAYYGTATTASMGVLGEAPPATMHRRLVRAAAPYAAPSRPVQPVYELIVTVADPVPGPDGDYSHDIDRASVQRYIDAAHRHGALLLLDVQPGRSDFLTVAKRWRWALEDPYVGLALDPEWRMGPGQVPARVIGSVSAREVNRTAHWLSELVRIERLPEKLFVLHQFRTSMIRDIDRIRRRPGLAMVQHVDGFGTPAQKRATYGAVARPSRFTMGFKLFYDEDVRLLGPAAVLRLRPRVRFVSYQ